MSTREESKTFISENDGDPSQSFLSASQRSKRTTKNKIKRKFGLNKKKAKKKKNPEEELNKLNDNFWPIGNRSFTGSEMVIIGFGSIAGVTCFFISLFVIYELVQYV